MIGFVAIKYVGLALNASRSLVLAALLGPQSFGVLGTLVVVQQYLSYAALGMREALTVRLARPGTLSADVLRSSALAWGFGVGLAIVVALLAHDRIVQPSDHAWLWVGVIALLSIVNEILINIHRDQHRLVKVALLEVAYNAFPLACALAFGRAVTVVLVLQAIALGLAVSVAGFLHGLDGLRWRHVSGPAMRGMVALGVPLALAAFFSASVTSVYVLLAHAMQLGPVVGRVAFANNIGTIVMFGVNMVAWAATSRSMRRIAAAPADGDALRNRRLTSFFRIAVLASVLAVGLSGPAVELLMPAYAGMERYALLFCLLQSTALLLYVELNHLSVHGRASLIAAGYAAVLGVTLLAHQALPALPIEALAEIGIGMSVLLGLACARLCYAHGLRSASLRSQFVFLLFPVLCALAFRVVGPLGAAAVTAAYLARALHAGRQVYALREPA